MLRFSSRWALAVFVLLTTALAACAAPSQGSLATAPAIESSESSAAQPAALETEVTTGQVTPMTDTTSIQAQAGVETPVGQAAPTPASTGEGSTESGAPTGPTAEDNTTALDSGEATEAGENSEVASGPMQTYTDEPYGFSITYPADFRQLMTADVSKYIPPPLSEVQFFPLAMVENNATSYAPPSLAVRVYANPDGLSPQAWLSAQPELGLQSATQTPVSISGVDGIQVCGSMTIAPACAIFVAHRGAILDFIPLGAEGDVIMKGLVFTP
jgi:hypothetical protein